MTRETDRETAQGLAASVESLVIAHQRAEAVYISTKGCGHMVLGKGYGIWYGVTRPFLIFRATHAPPEALKIPETRSTSQVSFRAYMQTRNGKPRKQLTFTSIVFVLVSG